MTVTIRTVPTVQIRSKTVPEILRHAALVIEELGLAKGEFQDLRGRVCVMGAINIATSGDPLATGGPGQLAAAMSLTETIWREVGMIGQNISGWNDHPERTTTQVAAILRGAADSYAG